MEEINYDEIIKDLSVGRYFTSYCVIDLNDSKIKASTENFKYKSPGELTELISMLKGASWKAKVNGIVIDGCKYTPIKSAQGLIYGQCQTGGCCLVKAEKIGIIAIYIDFKLYDNATRLIETVKKKEKGTSNGGNGSGKSSVNDHNSAPNGASHNHSNGNNNMAITNGVNNKNQDHSDYNDSNTTSNGKEIVMHKGVCGLSNLGNTCFMNSSVQCLAHTIPFVEYFLSGRYTSDINKVNPLGMKGQIVEIFGKLMRDMWSGASYVVPKNLKWAIGKYAPQFSGISQQDSQDLLSFLLDGLHEDLNKVIKKPYIEEKDDKETRDDSVVANEQWENHCKRNQSVVVNLFQGQYKSTLVCNQCSKVSITFDPFMFVTLPIPVPTERLFEILLFRCKPTGPVGPDSTGVYCLNNSMAPIHYCLRLNKRDFVQTLRIELSKASGIETPCLALAEIFRNRIYTFLSDQKNLSFIRDRDVIIGYELPVAGDDVSRLHVMQRRRNYTN
ncbi:peptidase C19 family protein [Heterostelium album PN500]|uniref:Peptidase C19 family protein n=1 Tax=Heterostelium pallidum (strain ATCC 26659 / Pp 5 / PN500) TaxID=670386 RepID=D3BEN6_HETP5|nr:peptidase C19 family protein [Heterostelium album PN500]EFA80367.1 peptidase C19 family protein [Heterostelium album PN500]|eukprot:XP_020432487.1 peptidase C19 family protein [Heterostelium album PN500]